MARVYSESVRVAMRAACEAVGAALLAAVKEGDDELVLRLLGAKRVIARTYCKEVVYDSRPPQYVEPKQRSAF
jgi:hypothetical protein